MLRFVPPVLLAVYAVYAVLAAPQTVPTSSGSEPSICVGYEWGVTIAQLNASTPMPVYNQYVCTTKCAGPAWVQSSTVPAPPPSISPWGTKYDCQIPEIKYYCGETPVATCCGNSTTLA